MICVGIATLDRVWFVDSLPTRASKIRSRGYLEVGGGQAANAAVTAVRLGGSAALWCRVGADSAGAAILEGLRQEQVEVAGVEIVAAARSIGAAILVESSGERSIVADFDPALFQAAPAFDLAALRRADVLLADVKWPDGAEKALEMARREGIPTVLDIEFAAAATFDRLCPLADHAIFGQAGLAAYSGCTDWRQGLDFARRRLNRVVGVTLGAQGVVLSDGGREISLPAPRVDVVDTTGAGDAFHGAYALAIGEGKDWITAGRFANAVAALKCTRAGGRAGLPTRAAAEACMEALA